MLRPPSADLLTYSRVADDPKRESLPEPPRLPQRAAIYIAPDGNVHFGALFADLLPVAFALGKNELQHELDPEHEHEHGHG